MDHVINIKLKQADVLFFEAWNPFQILRFCDTNPSCLVSSPETSWLMKKPSYQVCVERQLCVCVTVCGCMCPIL